MRPEPGLSAAALDLARDLVPPRGLPDDVDDPTLLRLALGIADGAAREACARALLARPSTRARLARVRAFLAAGLAEEGWAERMVLAGTDAARSVERLLAEGRWADASGLLGRELPTVRDAWIRAQGLRMWDGVETIARAVLRPLLELGERAAFDDLLATAHAAAAALPSHVLRQWLLGYEGAAAAYRGDSDGARAAWAARAEECRWQGHAVGEADALLDLAALAHSDGRPAEAWSLLAEGEAAAGRTGRADYVATALSVRADLLMGEGLADEASRVARDALDGLAGSDGADVGLYVRMTCARTLARARRPEAATEAFADVLERCVESGRPFDAGLALAGLSPLAEAAGRVELAGRCLALAASIGRSLGSRRLEANERLLAEFRSRHPDWVAEAPSAWEGEARSLAAEVRGLSASPSIA